MRSIRNWLTNTLPNGIRSVYLAVPRLGQQGMTFIYQMAVTYTLVTLAIDATTSLSVRVSGAVLRLVMSSYWFLEAVWGSRAGSASSIRSV